MYKIEILQVMLEEDTNADGSVPPDSIAGKLKQFVELQESYRPDDIRLVKVTIITPGQFADHLHELARQKAKYDEFIYRLIIVTDPRIALDMNATHQLQMMVMRLSGWVTLYHHTHQIERPRQVNANNFDLVEIGETTTARQHVVEMATEAIHTLLADRSRFMVNRGKRPASDTQGEAETEAPADPPPTGKPTTQAYKPPDPAPIEDVPPQATEPHEAAPEAPADPPPMDKPATQAYTPPDPAPIEDVPPQATEPQPEDIEAQPDIDPQPSPRSQSQDRDKRDKPPTSPTLSQSYRIPTNRPTARRKHGASRRTRDSTRSGSPQPRSTDREYEESTPAPSSDHLSEATQSNASIRRTRGQEQRPSAPRSTRETAPGVPKTGTTRDPAQYMQLANFMYRPTPDNDPFPYPEDIVDARIGLAMFDGSTWALAGASRRGLSHWHKGTFRDDAFALQTVGGWHIMAVADGAGSARLSRETANRSVQLALDVIGRYATPPPNSPGEAEQRMAQALQDAVRQIHAMQASFTQQQGVKKQDTYCTLLLLIHQPMENEPGDVFGAFQVGDGYMMGMSERAAHRLAQGDHGADAGTSQFVLSFSADELASSKRIVTHYSPNPIHTFLLATDGIEDDLKPNTREYENGITVDDKFREFCSRLLERYLIWPRYEDWGEILLHVISYEKGSFDDRTITILTRVPPGMPYHVSDATR